MPNEMTEFRITSDLNALKQQVIAANFDEVRGWLQVNLKPYVDMVVTEDDIPAAKTYRANIRKVRDRIDECRKEAKAAALAAYTEFELKAKSLTGMCDSAAGALDAQIKVFEDKQAEAKIDALFAEYMAATNEEIRDYLPWNSIRNPKWGNKTYSAETAKKEILDAIERTKIDLAAIRDLDARDPAYLLDYYRSGHPLNEVVAKHLELEKVRERLALDESKKVVDATDPNAFEKAKPGDIVHFGSEFKTAEDFENEQDAQLRQLDFRVWATDAQLRELAAFLNAKGIKYGRVK